MPDLSILFQMLQFVLKDRTQLALENVALRQQLAVYKRTVSARGSRTATASSGSR